MAEPPLAVFKLDVAPAAKVVLLLIYRLCVRQDVLDLYQFGRGRPPFVWLGWKAIARETGYSRSTIYLAWSQLEAAGALQVAAGRDGQGTIIEGWDVLVLDPPVSGQQNDQPVHGIGQQERQPVHGTGQRAVHKTGPVSKGSDTDRPADRTRPSSGSDENLANSTSNFKNHDVAEENSETRGAREATPTPVESKAYGPEALIAAIAGLYTPKLSTGAVDRARLFLASDRKLLERARRLLAVPEQPSPEATQAALRERYEYVLAILQAVARLCARNPAKEKFWRPAMLETEAGPGKTKSAWAMLEQDASDMAEAEAAEQLRQRELEAASRPRDPRPTVATLSAEEEVARAAVVERGEAYVRSLRGKPMDDDEKREAASRRAAQRREAEDGRDEEAELQRKRAMNRDLYEALEIVRREHGENATLPPEVHKRIRAKWGFDEGP